jgi:hypothetical protein
VCNLVVLARSVFGEVLERKGQEVLSFLKDMDESQALLGSSQPAGWRYTVTKFEYVHE